MTEARTVEVMPGDTLFAIAAREFGDGNRWPHLFRMNQTAIEDLHRKRGTREALKRIGVRRFNPEDWIFPGQKLRVA